MPASADRTKDAIAIRELLRSNPKGLSITEIAEALGLHRNTAAKHLDMLVQKGEADIRKVGTAKTCFLARRMPVAALLHFSLHPAIVVDGRDEVVMVSQSALDLLECPLEVLYGEKVQNLPYPLFTTPEFVGRCREAVQGTQALFRTATVIRGRRRHLRVHLVPVVFDTGKDGCAIVLIDETACREATGALEASHRQYEALTADLPGFVLHTRPDLTIEFVNEAFCRHTGRTQEQLIGFRFLPLLPPGDRERMRSALITLTPESQTMSLDVRSVRTDGTLGWERWQIRGIFGDGGRARAYHLTGLDITELQQCREQLEQYHDNMERLIAGRTTGIQEANRTLLKVLAEKEEIERELLFTTFAFDHASDSIILFDRDGRIYKANETACSLLGYSQDEILGVTIFGLNPSITTPQWEEMWARAEPGKRERVVSVHRKKDGTVFKVEVSRTFVRFAGRMYFCSIAREVGSAEKSKK